MQRTNASPRLPNLERVIVERDDWQEPRPLGESVAIMGEE